MGIRFKKPTYSSRPGGPSPTTGASPQPVPALKSKTAPAKFSTSSEIEESESDSNWIVSYADMMTLLMSFFALMFSFSKVDDKKFEEVKKEVTKSFGGTYAVPFEGVDTTLKQVVENEQATNEVQVDRDGAGINIVFKSGIFFDSGGTELKPQSKAMLDRVIGVLSTAVKDAPIYVEGHTDDSPIATERFPSNWELSAARASLVIRMLEQKGFPKSRLHPIGYADSRPVLPNRDPDGKPIPENQAQNRRVVIRIMKGPT